MEDKRVREEIEYIRKELSGLQTVMLLQCIILAIWVITNVIALLK